jgi:DMSO/TMAO reductase YedYZ molybdopterin-dependent catalytic subunit
VSAASPTRSTRCQSRAALGEGVDTLPVAQLEGPAREIKLLLDHREDLVAERTRIQNRLRWLVHDRWPELELPKGCLDRLVCRRGRSRRLSSARATGEILERAGIRRDAVDVMPSGLDPTVVSGGVDVGHVRRPLPMSKALDDAILALEMNGSPAALRPRLPGAVRRPGWVGISSIKWVGQIEVSSQPLSLWNTTQYVLVGPTYTGSPPVTTQTMKSAFELPFFAEFPVGRQQVLSGRSWSANAPITRIEVSVDGGTTWEKARRHGPSIPQPRVRWSFLWSPSCSPLNGAGGRARGRARFRGARALPTVQRSTLDEMILSPPAPAAKSSSSSRTRARLAGITT